MFLFNKSVKMNISGLAGHVILFFNQMRHKFPPVAVGYFPDSVCLCVSMCGGGVQNCPFSVFDGEWWRDGPLGLCLGSGDRELPCMLWEGMLSSGFLVMCCPAAFYSRDLSGLHPFLCYCLDLEGTDSQELLFSSWMEATWCVLTDQPDQSSLSFP